MPKNQQKMKPIILAKVMFKLKVVDGNSDQLKYITMHNIMHATIELAFNGGPNKIKHNIQPIILLQVRFK